MSYTSTAHATLFLSSLLPYVVLFLKMNSKSTYNVPARKNSMHGILLSTVLWWIIKTIHTSSCGMRLKDSPSPIMDWVKENDVCTYTEVLFPTSSSKPLVTAPFILFETEVKRSARYTSPRSQCMLECHSQVANNFTERTAGAAGTSLTETRNRESRSRCPFWSRWECHRCQLQRSECIHRLTHWALVKADSI